MTDLVAELTIDLLLVLPLLAGALWLAIGIWPFVKYRYGSPFGRSLTAAAWLFGIYALVDWVFLHLNWFYDSSGIANPAVLVSEVRASVFTVAIVLLFLAVKWLYAGHARYDAVLAVPGLASLVVVWGGMTYDAKLLFWGPQLMRQPSLYAVWVIIQLSYILASLALTLRLFLAQRRMGLRLRGRIFWSAASLLAILVAWTSTNVYSSIAQTGGIPWFSSLLVIPAAMIVAAFLPLSSEEIGEVFRAVSEVEHRVMALYVFHRTGEPVAAVSASRTFPIEAEQLQGVLDIVGNFVETSMKQFRGYSVTAMRFDRLGIVAARGQYIIVAAVYDGPAYDAIRSELLRTVRDFEELRWEELSNWEGASRIAEEVADELSRFLQRPGGTKDGKPVGTQKPGPP